MLKESAVEKVMLCIFNSARVAEGCVSDISLKKTKTSEDLENCSLFVDGCEIFGCFFSIIVVLWDSLRNILMRWRVWLQLVSYSNLSV